MSPIAPRPLRLILAFTLLALSSCKQDGDGEKSATGGSEAPTAKVELWTMQLKPTFEAYVSGMLKDWEKAHPGSSVEWVDLPSSEIENKTLTAAASGHAPDLVNLNPAFANKLANADALAPLTIDPALKDQYFASAWAANTVNGQVVGIPWYLSTSVTLYNQAIWKEAGLKPGEWPATFKALGEAARTIKSHTKVHGFMPNFGDRGKFMEMVAAEGVPLLTADGKHAAFDTPAGVAVVEFWSGLVKEGIIPRESLTQGHREAVDRFQGGQTAVFPGGAQMLTIIKQNSPKLFEQLAVGPQITGASGKTGAGVMNLVIPRSSTHQALALDLAKWITSGPNQLAFAKLVPILPSVKSAAEDAYFKQAGDTLEGKARAISAAQLANAALLVPPLPHQSELAKSLDDALQRASLGQQTSAEALKQAETEWNQLLASP